MYTKLFGQLSLFQKQTSLCGSTDITYSARQVAAEKKAYLYNALECQKGILDSKDDERPLDTRTSCPFRP